VPATRYRPSNRAMPEHPPQVEYGDGEIVRRVGTTKAYVSFKGRLWKVPEAFCGESPAIRPRAAEGQYGVFFGAYEIANINLTQHKSVGDVSEQVSIMSPG
jgi:putative transposase